MIKNWKTTLCGALAGGLVAVQPLLAGNELDWKAVILGFVIAVFGYVSKDFNVSGTGQ